MEKYRLGEMEQRFADLIWDREPISSRKLTEVCGEIFSWKRTTTYTMLKRLCDREIFRNEKGTVISLMSKDDFLAEQGEKFLEETFKGSLPKFITAFTQRNKLSDGEIEEIRNLINEYKED